jgi:small subunit ribosomal protein S2
VVEQEAQRSGCFWVTERWLGGMLTNFQTIRKQIRRLKELERGQEENLYEFYTKKERLLLDRERAKLDKYLAGVKDMGRLPGAVFVVDARREVIAVTGHHAPAL